MSGVSSSELDHCRELALRPGSVFEFTSRFIRGGSEEPLLAIYALTQAICTIPAAHTDDTVKWEKLKWWGEEVLADSASPSRHPVLRALHHCGARSKLHDTLLLRLVSDAMMQIEAAPPADETAMYERFSARGQSEIELELALDGAGIGDQSSETLAGASTLLGLIEGFAPGRRSQTDSLPLNLLAKLELSIDDLGESREAPKLAAVISELTRINLEWYEEGLAGLKVFATGAGQATHLQLRWAMERRRLESIHKDIKGFLQSGTRFGLADAWFAWRFSRSLTRDAGG